VFDEAWQSLDRFDEIAGAYNSGETSYMVGSREVPVKTTNQTIEGIDIPRVSLPDTQDWGDRLEWIRSENVPGSFPFTGGVFPFKRTDEMPMRMFAGEGSSTTTNQRFHYLTKDLPFKRLSTAFDSITLYGLDATDERLDLWAKCCESGVSISNIDEMERLFEGFDLCSSNTSVSLTINGNYWGILAMFLQTAIRQQNRLFIEQNGKEPNKQETAEIKARALSSVRGLGHLFFELISLDSTTYRTQSPSLNLSRLLLVRLLAILFDEEPILLPDCGLKEHREDSPVVSVNRETH
jgi:methylmalonyl-CoA mutase